MKLQLFAEGGGDGAAVLAAMVPPLRRKKRLRLLPPEQGREAAAAEVDEMLSPAEEPARRKTLLKARNRTIRRQEQHRPGGTPESVWRTDAGRVQPGVWRDDVQATQKAYDSVLNEQGPVGRILNALGQKYGTAPGDYEALAAAVEGAS